MIGHAVVIAGGGPTGLMLASELALAGIHIERILASWVGDLAVTLHRGREVTGFAQDDTGAPIRVRGSFRRSQRSLLPVPY